MDLEMGDAKVSSPRNAVCLSVPPRYDAKPVRFALNQGSRKLYSGGVTCPGLICCAGLEHGNGNTNKEVSQSVKDIL